MIGASGGPYREALARGGQRYREVSAAVVVDEFLQARSPGYRERLDRLVPGAFAQAVADAATWFETELPAQLAWHFDTAEARQITHPVLSVLGGESERLWDRFGETHRWILDWLPHAEGVRCSPARRTSRRSSTRAAWPRASPPSSPATRFPPDPVLSEHSSTFETGSKDRG